MFSVAVTAEYYFADLDGAVEFAVPQCTCARLWHFLANFAFRAISSQILVLWSEPLSGCSVYYCLCLSLLSLLIWRESICMKFRCCCHFLCAYYSIRSVHLLGWRFSWRPSFRAYRLRSCQSTRSNRDPDKAMARRAPHAMCCPPSWQRSDRKTFSWRCDVSSRETNKPSLNNQKANVIVVSYMYLTNMCYMCRKLFYLFMFVVFVCFCQKKKTRRLDLTLYFIVQLGK